MVAQIDEQKTAQVTLAMDPTGQADIISDMLRAQLAAGMRPVSMHRGETPVFPAKKPGKWLDRSGGQAHVAVELVNIG
ncbi:MAG TPA: hypothetical protein PLN33_13555 [Hyphomonadaceae bacterium]|nr:hypothetical protein [Hyphomonadaceae bacterium]HPN07147.1 hypothetical protein [Hyphomonadaceae bacterium]